MFHAALIVVATAFQTVTTADRRSWNPDTSVAVIHVRNGVNTFVTMVFHTAVIAEDIAFHAGTTATLMSFTIPSNTSFAPAHNA